MNNEFGGVVGSPDNSSLDFDFIHERYDLKWFDYGTVGFYPWIFFGIYGKHYTVWLKEFWKC